jgi:hypothetical protein
MNSRRLMCFPHPEGCSLPQRCRKCRVVHHSNFGRPMSLEGQNLNPSLVIACQLPPGADIIRQVKTESQVRKMVSCRCEVLRGYPASVLERTDAAGTSTRLPSPQLPTPATGGPGRLPSLPNIPIFGYFDPRLNNCLRRA